MAAKILILQGGTGPPLENTVCQDLGNKGDALANYAGAVLPRTILGIRRHDRSARERHLAKARAPYYAYYPGNVT